MSGRPKFWTREVIIADLRMRGELGPVKYSQCGGGLRRAAEKEFGSFKSACAAAGVVTLPRGRPKLNPK